MVVETVAVALAGASVLAAVVDAHDAEGDLRATRAVGGIPDRVLARVRLRRNTMMLVRSLAFLGVATWLAQAPVGGIFPATMIIAASVSYLWAYWANARDRNHARYLFAMEEVS